MERACIIFLKFADIPGFREHVAARSPAYLYLFDAHARQLLAGSLVLNLPRFLPDDEVGRYNQLWAGTLTRTLSLENGNKFLTLKSKMLEESKRIRAELARHIAGW